jgi:hypothetical protein
MDHNESVRKFEHLMLKQADHAHDAAIELEALVLLMPSEKSRQLAQLQLKASHKQSKGVSRTTTASERELVMRAFLPRNKLWI